MFKVIGEVLGRALHKAAAKNIEINASRPRVCPCGAPGEMTIKDYGNLGAVPVEFWRCNEHANTHINAQFDDGHLATREECSTWQTRIGSNIVTDCGCGLHVGEARP